MRRIVYFFKGEQYSRYDVKRDRVEEGWPKKIRDEWEGLFPNGIDAAISGGGTRIYFFKGEQYSRYDIAEDRVKPGWPKKIRDEWKGLFPRVPASRARRRTRCTLKPRTSSSGNGRIRVF